MSSRRRNACFVVAGLLVLSACSVFAAEGDLLPYAVAIDVGYGEPGGPEFVRDELERELVRVLEEGRCFSSVGPLEREAERSPDLVLVLLLEDYRDRLDYEISLAARDAPDAGPQDDRRVVAKLRAEIHLALLLQPGETPVRSRLFREEVAYRPRGDEDPRFAVQAEFVDEIVRAVRKFACKGSEKKFDKEIRAARASVGTADDASR